jgi:hypothetical protein
MRRRREVITRLTRRAFRPDDARSRRLSGCGSLAFVSAARPTPVLRPSPTPTRLPSTSRLITGYRTRMLQRFSAEPPGRGGPPKFPPPPCQRSEPITPGSPSGLRFQAPHPFHGLRRDTLGSARLSLSRPKAVALTARQASREATDRSLAPPNGLSTLGFDPTRFQTEPPAC